ncbi:hypothetical protein Q0F98_14510 [Paenibacillus amylolyticus]|nr:hypothetical protein Q0F98_14510 [Paenibacillus amylolyticus]
MTNYNVFNQSNRPLFTQLTNTFSAPGIEASPDSMQLLQAVFLP